MKPLLGTYVQIAASHTNETLINDAVESAFSVIAQAHNLLTAFSSDSEIAIINAALPGETVSIHPWTYRVLSFSEILHAKSDGIFDIAYGEWQANLRPIKVLSSSQVKRTSTQKINLGGIGKGFAVDLATETLTELGIKNFTVNAGGDLRIAGETFQSVKVRNPQNPSAILDIGSIRSGAVATSAGYFLSDSESGAIISPQNGMAVLDPRSVTVLASECMIADGLTKVISLTNDTNHPLLKEYGAESIMLRAQEKSDAAHYE